jgi:hypothetical protein
MYRIRIYIYIYIPLILDWNFPFIQGLNTMCSQLSVFKYPPQKKVVRSKT